MYSLAFALVFGLWLSHDVTPADLVSFTGPGVPANVIAGNAVFSDVIVDASGKVHDITSEGEQPFIHEADKAVRQWTFRPAHIDNLAAASRVGVLTIFRPAALGNFAVGGPTLGFKSTDPSRPDRPPMPLTIFDPGYPVQSTASGIVTLELKISPAGLIDGIRVVRDVPSLTDAAKAAVQSWNYLPARMGGSYVRGTLIVVVSFLRPVVV